MQVYKFDIPEIKQDSLNHLSIYTFPLLLQPYCYEYDKNTNTITKSSFLGEVTLTPSIITVDKIENIIFEGELEKKCTGIYFNTLLHLFNKSVLVNHYCIDYYLRKKEGKIFVCEIKD